MVETNKNPRTYPLAWFALAGVAMFCLDHWFPIAVLLTDPWRWLGLALTVPGLALVLHSGAAFLRAGTGLLPFSEATRLVTGGLYRFTRNPMYLGMAVFLVGLAMILGSASPFVPAVIFVGIIDRQFIRNEEAFLVGTFGAEYRDYMQRVRRWL
jgi:protein-S-isoprenylcysteine O-methyltransferase Ste14